MPDQLLRDRCELSEAHGLVLIRHELAEECQGNRAVAEIAEEPRYGIPQSGARPVVTAPIAIAIGPGEPELVIAAAIVGFPSTRGA